MNEQAMYTSINKGIPNYTMIEISVNTLINECASNKEQLTNELKVLRELYRDNVIKIAGNTKSYEYFFDSLRIMTSYKNAESKLYISPIPFITKLKNILGVQRNSTDFNDQQLLNELLNRLDLLKKVSTPEELKQNFPIIYADYELSKEAYYQINQYKDKYPTPRPEYIQDKIDRQYNLYHSFALDTRFEKFLQKQYQMYRNLIVRRQFIEGYTNRNPLSLTMFEGLDKEKFELYLADKYLTTAISTDDKKVQQECIYYVATYIRETKISQTTIKNDDGKEVTLKKLVRRYKQFLQENVLIRPLDEPRENFKDYHIKHVQNHVKKYFFTNVNWQIVPPGKEDEMDRTVIESLNKKYNYLSPQEREQKILQRYSVYERKIKFYENSGYIYKIYGCNAFDGYIAYIYPNGEILMEKFFNDKANCIPTINEAIYNVQVPDFERLSKLSKTTLIKENGCKRIIHSGDWEERSQSIIDKPAIRESEEQIKKLIKKLKTSDSN